VLRIAAELLPSLHPGARFCRQVRGHAELRMHGQVMIEATSIHQGLRRLARCGRWPSDVTGVAGGVEVVGGFVG
jgi:hypothetical protein